MRMWMVDPKIMCRKHLLGEHVELHMLIGTILKGKSIQGYIDNNLVEVSSIQLRHQELVNEMIFRRYRHKSELPLVKLNMPNQLINKNESLKELIRRCSECRYNYKKLKRR